MKTDDEIRRAQKILQAACALKDLSEQGKVHISNWLEILEWVRERPNHFEDVLADFHKHLLEHHVEETLRSSVVN